MPSMKCYQESCKGPIGHFMQTHVRKVTFPSSALIIISACDVVLPLINCFTIFSGLLYRFLSPCRLRVSGTSTSSSVILRHFSPWRSRTTRGQVWKVTQTLSCPRARTTASPCPLTRKRVHIWPKVESSSSRPFPKATLTSSHSLNYWAELHITYACIIHATEKINYYFLNLLEVFIIKKFCFFFFLIVRFWPDTFPPSVQQNAIFWLFKYAF